MNKKEISEIKKIFTPDDAVITRICGCYVDGDKNIICKMKQAFSALPEEEMHKYLDIFRQTLSGTVGKNLLNMDFLLTQETRGGTQEFLLRLRDSKLEDDALIDELYEKIIFNYDYGMNYYIILIHVTYDVPGKASDGNEMFDASDYVHNFVLCSICPVNLTKGALGYRIEDNVIGERIRDWVVEGPAKGFMFPVFNDRTTDIHSALYFTKKCEDLQPQLIDNLFGTEKPLSAGDQNIAFNTVIAKTMGDDFDYEIIQNIQENLTEMIEDTKDEPEPLVLTKKEVKQLLEKSRVPEEKMEEFDRTFEEEVGNEAKIVATNIASAKKFNIETPDIVIKVNPDRADLVETRMIDGRQCIVIPVDDHIEVNGMNVRTLSRRKEE